MKLGPGLLWALRRPEVSAAMPDYKYSEWRGMAGRWRWESVFACIYSMYTHIYPLSCCCRCCRCLEHCCLLASESLWSHIIQGNQLTSLWQHFDTTLWAGIYVFLWQSAAMLALLCARLCLCARKGEKWGISKFLLQYQVMSCYSMEVKRGRYRAKERGSDCRPGTEFQASHCSWNFKNFERSDLNSETSNLMSSLRISGRIWEFSSILYRNRIDSYTMFILFFCWLSAVLNVYQRRIPTNFTVVYRKNTDYLSKTGIQELVIQLVSCHVLCLYTCSTESNTCVCEPWQHSKVRTCCTGNTQEMYRRFLWIFCCILPKESLTISRLS